MQIAENPNRCNAPLPDRPAWSALVTAMEKLPRRSRVEIARLGRKARAAKVPRLRRLTWRAVVEARRLAQVAQ
jgi:hypothetical protein